jgi:hypothetical protein
MRKLLMLPVTVPLAAVRGALDAAARTVADALSPMGPTRRGAGRETSGPPWDGYDDQSAREIVAQLAGADDGTRSAVGRYEAAHQNRTTVLRAARVTPRA